MKRIFLILFIGISFSNFAQQEHYEKAYSELKSMLEDRTELNFKKALFTIENAWFDNKQDYSDFENKIT